MGRNISRTRQVLPLTDNTRNAIQATVGACVPTSEQITPHFSKLGSEVSTTADCAQPTLQDARCFGCAGHYTNASSVPLVASYTSFARPSTHDRLQLGLGVGSVLLLCAILAAARVVIVIDVLSKV